MDQSSPHEVIAKNLAEIVGHLLPGGERERCRSFEEDAQHYGPLNRRPLGLRTIPLDRIVGSVGRARELGPDFRPLTGRRKWESSPRYRRIHEALKRGEILPPVELYKLGYHYYVLDGNHRIAALKEITGNDGEVDAYVTQFLPAGDTEAGRVFLERRAFEEATGLKQVGAVERGHYPALLEEIERERAEMSAATGKAVSLKEAAADWYVTVWLPRAEQIRRADLRRVWPEKRTADIYRYIREHQAAESARLGRPVGWDEALASFQACQAGGRRRRLPTLQQFLQRLLPGHRGGADGLHRTGVEPDLEALPESVAPDVH
jgi:hypothetical protein